MGPIFKIELTEEEAKALKDFLSVISDDFFGICLDIEASRSVVSKIKQLLES